MLTSRVQVPDPHHCLKIKYYKAVLLYISNIAWLPKLKGLCYNQLATGSFIFQAYKLLQGIVW